MIVIPECALCRELNCTARCWAEPDELARSPEAFDEHPADVGNLTLGICGL
jgi:hypothetical protein